MKKIWTYIIGALCILGGIVLIINPTKSLSSLVYYIGLVILISGVLGIISSIINKNYISENSYFISGIWNAIFGIILMVNKEATIKLIPTFLGIWLIITSLSNLIVAFINRNNYIDIKQILTNVAKLILGIVVFTTPIISIIFSGTILGIILIFVGVAIIISCVKITNTYKVKIK